MALRLIKLQGTELKSHQESKAAEDLTVAGGSPQKRLVYYMTYELCDLQQRTQLLKDSM